MYGYLYEKLKDFQTSTSEFFIFPILILLCHLFPSQMDSQHELAVYIPKLMRIILECRSERLRELAAASIVSIAESIDLTTIFNWLFQKRIILYLNWNTFDAILILIQTTLDFGKGEDMRQIFNEYLFHIAESHDLANM